MDFRDLLNQYIATLHCTAKDLAQAAGLSTAVISRYRSGNRTPSPDSPQLIRLADGVAQIAQQQDLQDLTSQTVLAAFRVALKRPLDTAAFAAKIDQVILSLKINVSEMAKSMNYDASFLSRIRNGKRLPSDVQFFLQTFSLYVTRHYPDEASRRILADLIGTDPESLSDPDAAAYALAYWLAAPPEETENPENNTSGEEHAADSADTAAGHENIETSPEK